MRRVEAKPMATSTVEDYLKQMVLEEQRTPGSRVSTGALAGALGVTPGSVTAMVKTLAESGLVDHEAYGGAALTEAGRRLALHVLRRHRLIELFLVRSLGFDWSEVHDEAERLEHAVSDRVVERIDELLGKPQVDPHGDPIPSAEGELSGVSAAALDTIEVGVRAKVARVADQDPDFLRLLESRGIRPGTDLQVVGRDHAADAVEIELDRGRRTTLGLRAAEKLFVERS
jgi:DtxR family Mn-dependent transcriptional regulator